MARISKQTFIRKIVGYQIFDSRGNPTVAAKIELSDGIQASAAVPSGASTGKHEACELRDGGKRFNGKGVSKAVANINEIIYSALKGQLVADQPKIDATLAALDGTADKSRLGANALLAVSLATARAAAHSFKLPLFKYLAKVYGFTQQSFNIKPMLNVLNGGRHADNNVDIQEFMLVPYRGSFAKKMQIAVEVYHTLKQILRRRRLSTGLGDEGGFAPDLNSNEQALNLLILAISRAGYQPDRDVKIAIDAAASEFYRAGRYYLDGRKLTGKQLIELYHRWQKRFPLFSIEDGAAEDDWPVWQSLTSSLGRKLMLVGDDLFVTNSERLRQGIDQKVANAILIKLNQIGTLTETVATIKLAQGHHYQIIISHRSGETSDPFIADLAVAVGAEFIKAGAPARSERLAKYNRLLYLEKFYF